jgi:hypothetical protein
MESLSDSLPFDVLIEAYMIKRIQRLSKDQVQQAYYPTVSTYIKISKTKS